MLALAAIAGFRPMKRLVLALAAITLVLTTAGSAGAQSVDPQSADPQSEDPQSEDGEIQILNVGRTDGGQVTVELAVPTAIGDLAPVGENFAVLVDGRPQKFQVAPLDTVVDVIMVIDTSGSMRGDALRAAKSAARAFINRLPGEARIGVISFGEEVTVHSTPDTNRNATLADVGRLASEGETSLWDALVTAADVAESADGRQPYVVLLSDGDDTVSTATRAEATSALVDAGVGLYAIAIESPDADDAALAETVDDVGGNFAATTGVDQLDALYLEVADRLASRYELSFQPERRGPGKLVLSVAAGEAIASARADIGVIGAVVEVADQGPAPVLNLDDSSQLGVVQAPSPGLLGGTNMLLLGIGAMFVALILLGVLMVSPSVHVRLDSAAGVDRVAGINGRMTRVADNLIARRDREGDLDRALDAAGVNLRPGEFVLISLVIVVVVALLGTVIGGFVTGVLGATIASVAVFLYLSTKAERRRSQFAEQLTNTLGIMTGSLRAGRGLPQAIELVAAESPAPTAEQFRRIVFETRVGRDMTESMMGVAKRMKSQDFEWVTRAVDINRELGGDLTEVLDNVADTIRDRRRVARMVRSLSAEGRASGWVLLALPVVMFLFMWWRTPENISLLLSESLGRLMLAAGLAGMTVGYFWIRRLVDLKY